MELLEKRIQTEGHVLPGGVLKVDSFLNHQVDAQLMMEMGKEFARLFADAGVQRILTIEASGISMAFTTALELNVPFVFARKKSSVLMTEPTYVEDVYSFTKKETSHVTVLQKFLPAGERVLIIDDFLANGEAALGMARIVEKAGSEVAGIGIAIEKAFQKGHQRIIDAGYHLESLASIASLEDEKVTFVR